MGNENFGILTSFFVFRDSAHKKRHNLKELVPLRELVSISISIFPVKVQTNRPLNINFSQF